MRRTYSGRRLDLVVPYLFGVLVKLEKDDCLVQADK